MKGCEIEITPTERHPTAGATLRLAETREDIFAAHRFQNVEPDAGRSARLLVYSHDTFGLGNIRRMIAVCEHLHELIPGLSILILTGSPMLHSFRLSHGIDYVKLPCLRRDPEGGLGVKFLGLNMDHVVRLRRAIILSTVANFRPHVLLVDKKPGGLAGELEESLRAIRCSLPATAVVLLLRDILDGAAATIDQWKRQSAYELLEKYYHKILVAGLPELYDVREEYQFSRSLRAKVRFCGYLRRQTSHLNRDVARKKLQVGNGHRMVLVTTGGGEDGYTLIQTYLRGLASSHDDSLQSVIVTGPELPEPRKRDVMRLSGRCRNIRVIEFTDDLMSYIDASDVVVGMAGYNTVCEILSLRKRAVIVPRVTPVEEQKIRAERMAQLSLFRVIHPNNLTPGGLMEAVRSQLEAARTSPCVPASIDLDALPRIGNVIRQLTWQRTGADSGSDGVPDRRSA